MWISTRLAKPADSEMNPTLHARSLRRRLIKAIAGDWSKRRVHSEQLLVSAQLAKTEQEKERRQKPRSSRFDL